MKDLENMLRRHADSMKNNMASPFQEELEELIMTNNSASKARKTKRIAFIALAAALLLGTTAFAAGGYVGGWFSGTIEKFESMPDEAKLSCELGYTSICIPEFENGYAFKAGSIDNNEVFDPDLGLVDNFKSATFVYEKDGDSVYFTQTKSDRIAALGEILENHKGIDIYFYSYINKVVPADYQLTMADKAAEESGEVIFSYGSDKIITMEVTDVQWAENGITYNLTQMGGKLSADDMANMAKEIINK